MELFPEIQIDAAQAEAMARGLWAVARAEGGVHPQERALIQSFYGDATDGSAGQLAALERMPDVEPQALAQALTGAHARIFIKTAVLLGYVDGQFGGAERALVDRYAEALGVSKAEVGHLEQAVKEYLLGQLSNLKNVDAVRQVAHKLGV